MKSSSSRLRQRRTFVAEGLEDRNLLSVAHPAIHSAPAAEIHAAVLNRTTAVPVTALNGTAIGQIAPNGLYAGNPVGFVSYSGHGVARPIGPALFGIQFLPKTDGTTTTTITNGTALITDSKTGEQVIGSFEGTGTAVARGRAFSATLTGIVAGGTGQYDNATGTFTATGRFSASGRFTLRYQVAIA